MSNHAFQNKKLRDKGPDYEYFANTAKYLFLEVNRSSQLSRCTQG